MPPFDLDSPPGGSAESAGRILVVDDEPTLRMGFRLALLTEGYQVEIANDGEAALARIAEEVPTLMVLDLRMPGIDGLGVLRRLMDHQIFVPTVLASAHMDDAVVREALLVGAVDFLSKPVRPDELRELTHLVIEEEARFAARTEQSPEQLSDARCLLRRGRTREAMNLLDRLAEQAREIDETSALGIWRRVARNILEGDSDDRPISMRHLLQWHSSHES